MELYEITHIIKGDSEKGMKKFVDSKAKIFIVSFFLIIVIFLILLIMIDLLFLFYRKHITQ